MVIKNRKGFSLVELLVVIAIISLLAVVVLYNYRGTNDRLALTSATQEVAIHVRQAQAYGLSVKEANTGSGVFDYPYGVYFNKNTGQDDKLIIFVDKNLNNKYEAGSGCGAAYALTECVEQVFFRNGIRISGLQSCNPATMMCSTPGPDSDALQITFIRPNTDASSYFTLGAGTVAASANIATISLVSPAGNTRTISVYKTGQITLNVFAAILF